MWALVDAKLCTMHDLRTNLTIDDYAEAWEYLASKRQAEMRMMEEAKQGGRR
jgi:hypothetical protein